LLLIILGLGDSKNFAPEPKNGPVIVGLAVMLIGMSFGMNAGYADQPRARPSVRACSRSWAAGAASVFTAGNGWWWVPIVGPLVGGVLGGYVYDVLITKHHAQ
jgi:glycerol uptake facilitator-like aquaporin